MKLYIIGNGFDLAHHLPTSYWDFRKFLEQVDYEFLEKFESHYQIYSGASEEEKRTLLWNELEANLANINEDVIIENALQIDMNLDSGDVGIEDTLYYFFEAEYGYIKKLAMYLKRWVRSIKIRDTKQRVSRINKRNNDLFVNFNYTATLENVYEILPSSVIHIHGSLRDYTEDPILGHGNVKKINAIQEKIDEAEEVFDEKKLSICRVMREYYKETYKDISKYTGYLMSIKNYDITEIIIAGHSLAGIDMPYFSMINTLCGEKVPWKIVKYDPKKYDSMKESLINEGIDFKRIDEIPSDKFYDL